MTDDEIMKKIEWVIKCNNGEMKNCIGCPVTEHYPYCDDIIIKASLALINRQKAEIERLKSMNQAKLDMIHDLQTDLTIAKAEAIKEFAEKLKEKAWIGMWETISHVDVDDIDNLIKEMTEKEPKL